MKAQTALALCERHVRHADVSFASSYGEPGYSDPPAGILFADWNDCPDWLQEGLKRRGFELEWSDEWIISYENNSKAYRQSPDCYAWTPYYVLTEDGDVIGGDEIEDGSQAEWYVNEYLLNDPNHCNVFRRLDLAKFGFVKHNGEYETGFHPGQNDDPRKVFEAIRAQLPDCDVVFELNSKGQFDCAWSAWVRPVVE